MSRKKSSGKSKQKKNSHAMAGLAPPPSSFNPYALYQQAPYFPPPTMQNYCAPFMQPQPALNYPMQYAPPFYPQGQGMGMPVEFMFQQPMAPYFMNHQLLPQPIPLNVPFPPNMCTPNDLPSTSAKTKKKTEKKEESSKSSSSEESADDESCSNDEDKIEIVNGTSKNCGAIYKPGYSKPEDVDEESADKEDTGTAGRTNSRKGSVNKKTMANLRRQAVEFFEAQKKKKQSERPAKSACAKAAKATSSKVKEQDYSSSESEDFVPKKKTTQRKKK